MVRPCTLSLALVLATGLAAQKSEKLTLYFPLASAAIDNADEAALRALCDRDDVARVSAVTLIGHTDVRGTIAYNEALSERRAEAVRKVLRSTCLEGKPVNVQWSGETEPVAQGDSENDHARNRRVDVQLEYVATAALHTRPDAHPKVVPLLPSIDKPQERYRVNAAEAIDLTMSDGVRVRIPAGAIVNADGTTVNAPVDLSYRSFSEPYEIIASGIPMHVNTADGVQHFETAGMYELYASLDGAPLALSPGSSITLERPQTLALDPNFVGWELDPATGGWVPRGTLAGNVVSPISQSLATAATSLYWNTLWSLEKQKKPDTTLFEQRRLSDKYCHLTTCDVNGGNTTVRPRNRVRYAADVPSIRVKGHRGIYDPEHVVFEVEMERDDARQFPEWRRIPASAIWEYTGSEPRAVFKMLYGRKHRYQDVDLEMHAGSEEGVLRLKENGEWLELPVSTRLNHTNAYQAQRWETAIKKYDTALAKQERNFDREVNKQVARYDRDHADMPASAWKQSRTAMDTAETPLDLAAWKEYASTRQPVRWEGGYDYEQQQQQLAAVQTTFGLESFGVYNIDRIMKMNDQLNVLAAAVDADGKPFPWVNGFAVLNNENSVITYWGNSKGLGDNFLVSPGKMKSLFLVDADGRIARADVGPLNSRDARVVLKVTPLNDPKSIDDLRAQATP